MVQLIFIVFLIVVFLIVLARIMYRSGSDDCVHQDTKSIMILTCVETEGIDAIALKLGRGKENMEFVLEGGSLGYMNVDSAKKLFDEHLQVAIASYGIKELWIIDHMHCEHYKQAFEGLTPITEREVHLLTLNKMVQTMTSKFESLVVRTFIMNAQNIIDEYENKQLVAMF